MVNYCYVRGCSRNSRVHKHLNFYTFPRDSERVKQWMAAAGRLESNDEEPNRPNHSRICSRHFEPSCINNRKLSPDAIPTLFLKNVRAGSESNSEESEQEDLKVNCHNGIICNNCKNIVYGFRYKCVTCPDFDLCQKCETLETHNQHFMLRIPNPVKFKKADNLVNDWQRFFKADHAVPNKNTSDIGSSTDSSDDDVPITKYSKNYDSGTDLSEDIKNKIRKEVSRVLTLKPKKAVPEKPPVKTRKRQPEPVVVLNKRLKVENEINIGNQRVETYVEEMVPEVAFADVNEGPCVMDMKTEFMAEPEPSLMEVQQQLPGSIPIITEPTGEGQQPMMRVKLSDDLSELMIEVTSNNQKTIYKYN